jgi:hypothetical protein
MAKEVMKSFDEFYTKAFGVPELINRSKEDGAKISEDVEVKELMNGLKKFYDSVKQNVSEDKKAQFKEAVKDYSQYYNLKDSNIDYTIVENNRIEKQAGRAI